jgi:recombination protein RecT
MTENTNALALSGNEKLRTIMRSPDVLERFAEVLGQHGASAYISSVLLAVANSDDLQKCDTRSIITSAMRAATLKLSCDPLTKQAHLVPFKGRATLVVGYKGYYDMAQRTGRYRFLNDFKLYEGQTIVEDQLTGETRIEGYKSSSKIVGYGFYFELKTGLRKTFYMSIEEIREHGKQYSKTFDWSNSPWKTDFPAMARKTVVRLALSRYGYLDPTDQATLASIDERESEVEDVEYSIVPPKKRSQSQIMSELGFEDANVREVVDPETGEIREVSDDQIQEQAPEKKWTSEKVTLERARAEKSSDGSLYWDMSDQDLGVRLGSLNKVLRKNDLPEEERAEKSLKRDVIQAIVEYRK